LPKELFNELTNIKTKDPILLVSTPKLPVEDFKTNPKGIEVLLPAGDPKNLGALIRTCLAFDVKKIVLLEEAANPFLPDSIKASSGNVFKAPLFKGPSIKDLQIENVYTLDVEGTPIREAQLSKRPLRLLIGEEGGHLSKELKSKSLSIPISSKVESLNVNSCLSIALYELS
jgi:tRNA G18 (ribose-2'-O)-methylase SpoU